MTRHFMLFHIVRNALLGIVGVVGLTVMRNSPLRSGWRPAAD
jgi:hypothetical protein